MASPRSLAPPRASASSRALRQAACTALPTLAIQLGWLAAEMGRQPWIVYGLMRTREGVSKVVLAPEIVTSIALFGVIYLLLGAVWIHLLRREVVHGPEGEPLPELEPAVAPPLSAEPVY